MTKVRAHPIKAKVAPFRARTSSTALQKYGVIGGFNQRSAPLTLRNWGEEDRKRCICVARAGRGGALSG
jgi:hypothetical protein